MPLPRLRRWTMADSARWGRRALLAAFLFALTVECLIAFIDQRSGVRQPQVALRTLTFDMLSLVLAGAVIWRGDPWRRCLAAVAASLAATAAFVPLGATGLGFAEEAALGRLLLLGVRVLPPRLSRAAAILVTSAMLAVPLRWGWNAQAVFLDLFVALGATLIVAAGLYLRGLDERRERAVVDVRRAERLQLARELHDFVAHHVTGIVVGAQAAQMLAGTDPDRALASLPAIEAAGQKTLASMHRLVGMMRDAEGEAAAVPGSDAAALHDLVDDFSRTGLPVRLRLEAEPGRLPPEVAMSAYRIVREALTNARKYAVRATHVDVDIRRTEAGLLVVVRDDCAGGGAAARHHRGGFGLVGLTERAEAVGGRLHAGRHAAGGWEVTAVLPIPEELA